MNTDHVQCYTCEVSCNHCGLAPTLDAMSAVALIDVVGGFLLMHRRCEKPVEPSKQVELFDALAAKEQTLAEASRAALERIEAVEAWEAERPITSPSQRGKCGLCGKLGPLQFYETGLTMACLGGCAGIDGMSDSPDPETDPPGPMARHGEGPLLDAVELRHLITCVRPKEFWPSVKEVATWHTDVMADVQRWCRVEHARAHPIAGQPMPLNCDMPNVLQNVEFAKPKRGGLEMNEAYTRLIRERALQEEAARDRQAARTRAAWARGAFATKRPSCSRRNEANLAEARRLRGLGKTMAQIGSALGVTEYTARCWLGYRRPKK